MAKSILRSWAHSGNVAIVAVIALRVTVGLL